MSQRTLPKPLYAAAGAGSLIARKLTEAGPKLQEKAATLPQDAQRAAGDLSLAMKKLAGGVPDGLRKFVADTPSYVDKARRRAQEARSVNASALRSRAQDVKNTVSQNLKAAGVRALSLYDDLVVEGTTLVDDRSNATSSAPSPTGESAGEAPVELTRSAAQPKRRATAGTKSQSAAVDAKAGAGTKPARRSTAKKTTASSRKPAAKRPNAAEKQGDTDDQ